MHDHFAVGDVFTQAVAGLRQDGKDRLVVGEGFITKYHRPSGMVVALHFPAKHKTRVQHAGYGADT